MHTWRKFHRHHHAGPCGLRPRPGMIIGAVSLLAMGVGTVVSLFMVQRLIEAAETLAMTQALDELGDRLSDVERADLEGRIRAALFPAD